VLNDAMKEGSSVREHHSTSKGNVLVYASPDFVKEGKPKEEYVKRINNGIRDARILGMTPEYVQYCVRRYIPPDGQATAGTHIYPMQPEPQTPGERQETSGVGRGAIRREHLTFEEISARERIRDRPNDRRSNTSPGRPFRSQSLKGVRYVERSPRSVEFRGVRQPKLLWESITRFW